jgi:LysM repeat protein
MSSKNRAFGAMLVIGALLLIAGAMITAFNFASPASNSVPIGVIALTIYPTQPLPQTETATVESIAVAEATTAVVLPTPGLVQYVIRDGDNLWDIALRSGFVNPDPILAVNPGLNPDQLSIGQVLNIPQGFLPPPLSTREPQTSSAQASTPNDFGRVKPDAGGLRLRRDPIVGDNIVTKLSGGAQLRVLGASSDKFWLHVLTQNNVQGWVMAQYVDYTPAVVNIAPALVTVAPLATAQQNSAPFEYPPYLSDVSPRVFEIYQAGLLRGNNTRAFALVGDSNTEDPKFFKPFDWGQFELGNRYAYLKDTVDYFRGSFGRSSPAAVGGFNTTKILDPNQAKREMCNAGETPIACEYRLARPSIALILIGTGDQHSWQSFEGRYRQIIDITISYGIIPVLITKGDELESRDNSAPYGYINAIIRRLAAEYQVPLLNLSQVLETLPNRGMTWDGFHYNWPPDNRTADFTGDRMLYGFNARNLTALQALDVLRRRVFTGQ